MSIAHRCDLAVVGGGVVGLSAAIGMALRGYQVTVIDSNELKVDSTTADVRVYAINQASQRLLQQLGVWDDVRAVRYAPYERMHVWDASNHANIDFDCRLIGQEKLGVITEEGILKQVLLAKAKALGITLFAGQRVSMVEHASEGMCLRSSDRTWHAKLLFIADGANSATRQLLNIELIQWPYHQSGLVATVSHDRSHQRTAYQVFLPQGPLAFLPLQNPYQSSIVWSTGPAHAASLMAMSEADFNQALTEAFAQTLGQSRVESLRYQFPLMMRHAKRYSGANWLLLGDAAHTIHPLAGLGLNVGLADVATWLCLLDEQPSKTWTARQLAAYQRQRKNQVWKVILLMQSFKQLFASPLPPVRGLRGLGLTTCNALPFLKRFFIQQAAG